MDVARLSDLVDRLGVAAELEADGVPAEELAEQDDECAALAVTFGSFGAAHAATCAELSARTRVDASSGEGGEVGNGGSAFVSARRTMARTDHP